MSGDDSQSSARDLAGRTDLLSRVAIAKGFDSEAIVNYVLGDSPRRMVSEHGACIMTTEQRASILNEVFKDGGVSPDELLPNLRYQCAQTLLRMEAAGTSTVVSPSPEKTAVVDKVVSPQVSRSASEPNLQSSDANPQHRPNPGSDSPKSQYQALKNRNPIPGNGIVVNASDQAHVPVTVVNVATIEQSSLGSGGRADPRQVERLMYALRSVQSFTHLAGAAGKALEESVVPKPSIHLDVPHLGPGI